MVVEEPKTHPLFDQVGFVEVSRQAEYLGQEISADFDGRLPDPPSENLRLFQNQNPQLGPLAFEQERAGRARHRAANDNDIKLFGFNGHD